MGEIGEHRLDKIVGMTKSSVSCNRGNALMKSGNKGGKNIDMHCIELAG